MTLPPAGYQKTFRTGWFKKPRVIYCALALFSLAFIVRLVPIGRYVTPDEPIWVLRSVRLRDAFITGHWSAIPQTGHPGYTTMVLGAIGVQLSKWLQPEATLEHLTYIRDITWLTPESSDAFPHLVFFLGSSRILVAMVCAAGLSLIYVTGRQSIGERASRLLVFFLALDPFFIGHAALLHTDALQATFVLLSILCILPSIHKKENSLSVIASALFLALAGLTKTLGLLVAPGMALAILVWGYGTLLQRCVRVAGLALLSATFIFILFPPFWANPADALQNLLQAVLYHQGVGLRDVYFAGQMHIDPGPVFYPAVILFRVTTPVFAGLLVLILKKDRVRHDAVKWFLVPVVVYVLAMSFGAKKFDRYVLTAITLLTAAACLAWQKLFSQHRILVLTFLCIPWALVSLIPLYHANTVLGGPWVAQHIIPFGWGEGSGFAARDLNTMVPDPSEYIVMTGDVPGVASLYAGPVLPKDASRALCADILVSKTAPDFPTYQPVKDIKIAGIHLTTIFTQTLDLPEGRLLTPGRIAGIPSASVAPSTTTPELQTWLSEQFAGNPFTWIHATACNPITEAQLTELLCSTTTDEKCNCTPTNMVNGVNADKCQFPELTSPPQATVVQAGELLEIIYATWAPVVQAPETLVVHMRWRVRQPYEQMVAYLALRDAEGVSWAEGSTPLLSNRDWLKSAHSPGTILDGEVILPLYPALLPGNYTLTLSFSDSEGRLVGLINPDGSFGGTRVDIGSVAVQSASTNTPETTLPIPLDITITGLHVRGASSPPTFIYSGDPLPFRLEIARTTEVVPETALWTMQCEDGTISQGSLFDERAHTESWRIGHYYELRYAPRTNPELSNTECMLSLPTETGTSTTLGTFHVQARERSFSLSRTPQLTLDYRAGAFGKLIGADIPGMVSDTAAPLQVTLFWQAIQSAEVNYTVFVHLTDGDGRIVAQSDALPQGGNAPTISWLPGQVIVDTHYLEAKVDIPPGEYILYAGFYDAETGYRETLFTAGGEQVTEDQIPLGVMIMSANE